MNIQQLKYILAVVDSDNYETAAEKCFVTQSTLSTMIVKFEDEIGIKVFNRSTKPVTLTNEGKIIVSRIRYIIKEIKLLNNQIKELKNEISGELTIGVIPTIAPYLLPLFLSDFAKSNSKLKITIKEITTHEIKEELINQKIDIGIVALPLEEKRFNQIELYKEAFVIYDYTSKPVKFNSIEDIDTSKLWLLQENHCMRSQVDKICKINAKNKKAIFDFESASMMSLLNFTKQNKGITIIPYLATLSMSKDDQKRIFKFKNKTPLRSVGLITNEHFAKYQLLKLLENVIKKNTKKILPTYDNFEVITP